MKNNDIPFFLSSLGKLRILNLNNLDKLSEVRNICLNHFSFTNDIRSNNDLILEEKNDKIADFLNNEFTFDLAVFDKNELDELLINSNLCLNECLILRDNLIIKSP